eukprot:6718068-Prymnesium_polylepis.1
MEYDSGDGVGSVGVQAASRWHAAAPVCADVYVQIDVGRDQAAQVSTTSHTRDRLTGAWATLGCVQPPDPRVRASAILISHPH